MRTFLLALVAFFLVAAPASAQSTTLVVNEVDYDQPSTDTAEFIEIKNVSTSPINLSGYALSFRNGASGGNAEYRNFPLNSVDLAGGEHYVLCANAANTPSCDQDVTPEMDLIQNGAPDALALVQGATIVDAVSYEGEVPGYTEGLESAPTDQADGAESISRVPDGCDTNDNDADFEEVAITPGASNGEPACGGPPVDPAPSVSDTSPDANATQVPLDANVEITFSEPVNLALDAVTIQCAASDVHPATRDGGPTTFTFDPATDFARNESCTVTVSAAGVSDQDADDPPDAMANDFSFTFSTLGLAGLRIHDIQGAQHVSPHDDDFVDGVPGVVTAVRSNGYYFQDPRPDRDERTSEGLFVFTGSSGAKPAVGQSITVTGLVQEFRPGGANGEGNLSTTELTSSVFTVVGSGAIAPTTLGLGGRLAPIFVIDDDAVGGTVENPATRFDPREDGIDFHESLEGMLVRVRNPLAVGPTNDFEELPVVADLGLLAFPHTLRGGLFVHPDDFNPERIILDDALGLTMPAADVRDRLSTVEAIVDYDFGNFKYLVTAPPTVHDGGLKREVTQAPKKDELAVGSMNVENLDPNDPPEKFAQLASILVNNMKSPDVVAIEEVQDNNGAAAGDGTTPTGTNADGTYTEFIETIDAIGPRYEFRQINPQYNRDGGEPSGNIRVGFLYRTDRGLAFVDRPGGDATTPTAVVDTPSGAELSLSPGRIDPQNTAFTNSRKPLAGEFTWKGQTVFVVANHFNSKGGDEPLFGRFQPPNRVTETQRHLQATVVGGFVEDLLAADPNAKAIVLGDLNDFEFSETLDILEDSGLTNLMETLPVWERYTYVFDGNSQTLDQILVTRSLKNTRPEYDSVHVNAEFHEQASDHDPQVARVEVPGRRR